ncbi:MAG: Fic family protein [Bifidobacteriaceae bacterium]|jgi:Fic family protein|nr:Fic family protein [Bifidobacteriaceae bacterium]
MEDKVLYSAPPLGDSEMDVIGRIDHLRAQLRGSLSEPRRWTRNLRRLALGEAVKSSNQIEGFISSLDQAVAVVDRRDAGELAESTKRALAGYRDAMTFSLQLADDHEAPEYSSHLIRGLHFMITSGDSRARPGSWRAGPIYVTGAGGAIAYTAPDPDQVPGLMAELVGALNQPTDQPLVAAAMAHLNLVRVHPFRDGNGRTARCLQSLVLARHGVVSAQFMSIEEYLGTNTNAYYAALASTGSSHQPARSALPWVRFVLAAHLHQTESYQRRLRDLDRLWLELASLADNADERALTALMDAALGLRVTRASYQALLAADGQTLSARAAARDLAALAAAGLLTAQGDNRARAYSAGPAVAAIWDRIVADAPPADTSKVFPE